MSESKHLNRGEVYFEFTPVGNSIRVVAIDATTGVEITMVGSNNVGQEHLKRLAMRKLLKRIRDELG